MANLHRALALAVAAAAISLACGLTATGFERCRDLPLGTAIDDLPVDADRPAGLGQPMQGPAQELACCRAALADPDGGEADGGCGVDCTLPENQATPVALGGGYTSGACAATGGGISLCTAWVRDGGVVATQYFCEE